MSQDPEMIKAYNEGKDLYAVIAQAMFKNKYEDNLEFYPEGTEIELDGKKIICGKKTHLHKAGKERRAKAKTMLLAILYGMSPKTAGIRMGYDAKEAQKAGQELMDGFFAKFKNVKALMEDSKNDLLEKGYVEDWAGRQRRLPDIEYQKSGHLYEARLKDGNRFNPFLECGDSVEAFPEERFWNGVVSAYAALSKVDHERRNEPYRDGEMSNKTFEWLARIALNPDKMKNLPRYLGDDAVGKKANPKSFDKLYEDCGNYLGCRTREAFEKIFPKKPVILSAFTGRVAQAERQCLNARIQGGAASLTKLAMVNIFNDEELRRLQAKLIITVHDEVLVECPALYADQVEKRLPQIMIDTAKPFINVPMSCDPYNVSRWYCDEAAVSVREEFKKFEAGNKDKGVAPMKREDALNATFKNHPELPEQCIVNAIENGSDLEF